MMPTHKMYSLILPHFSVPKDLSFGPILDACKDSFLLKLLMRIQAQQNCEKELSVQRCFPSLHVESICLKRRKYMPAIDNAYLRKSHEIHNICAEHNFLRSVIFQCIFTSLCRKVK